MGPGHHDSLIPHTTSSDTGSLPYCPTPKAIVPVHESHRGCQKVLLWKGLDQCRSASHTVAEGDSFVTGETPGRAGVTGTVGGMTSVTVGATVDSTVCDGRGSCKDCRKLLLRADPLRHWRKFRYPRTTEFLWDRVTR